MFDPSGKRLELEAGGRFYHVALKTEKGWLHSYPGHGVELFESLDQVSKSYVILQNPDAKPVSMFSIHPYLGLPFDFYYRWDDENSSYCSKLVAQILGVLPKPMNFSTNHWERAYGIERGEFGLSPDDLFAALVERGYRVRTAESDLDFRGAQEKPRHCEEFLSVASTSD